MDPFIGQINAFPYSRAPSHWAFCHGQTMTVAQNQALFSLIGNAFGGNPTNDDFSLPDLRGRVIRGAGAGPGLSSCDLGFSAGVESASSVVPVRGEIALTVDNLPPHHHEATFTPTGGGGGPLSVTVTASTNAGGNATVPSSSHKYLGATPTGGPTAAGIWSQDMSDPVEIGGVSASGGGIAGGTVAVGDTGDGEAVEVRLGGEVSMEVLNPFLALNFCIALQGQYPSFGD